MTHQELLNVITVDPQKCGGFPCIKGTRIYVSIILDALSEGLTPEEILEHYPNLTLLDIRGALAYGAELTRENIWRVSAS